MLPVFLVIFLFSPFFFPLSLSLSLSRSSLPQPVLKVLPRQDKRGHCFEGVESNFNSSICRGEGVLGPIVVGSCGRHAIGLCLFLLCHDDMIPSQCLIGSFGLGVVGCFFCSCFPIELVGERWAICCRFLSCSVFLLNPLSCWHCSPGL